MATAMTTAEQRKTSRLRVEKIVSIGFGQQDGGIIRDISEGGICFQMVVPMQEGAILDFWLSAPGRRIEGQGRVVWTDETRTRGGLCFTELSADAREQIYDLRTESAVRGSAVRSGGKVRSSEKIAKCLQIILLPARGLQEIFEGFSGGLVTGILLSVLVAGAVVHRRQVGEWLIVMGEHLVSRTPSVSKPYRQPLEKRSPMAAVVRTGPAQAIVPTDQKGYRANNRRPINNSYSRSSLGKRPQSSELAPAWQTQQTRPANANSRANGSVAAQLIPPSLSLPSTSMPASLPGMVSLAGAAKPSQLPPGANTHAEVSLQQDGARSSARRYFEIGKFKEHSRAADETEKLAQLGFPATIRQKHLLWMNFYDVLVGPYRESEAAEVAHRNLLVRGFKPRAFERGYQYFSLPSRLTLNGARTPVGFCAIKWESYVDDVAVKFEQNNRVVLAARGTWEKHYPSYQRSAVVYTQNRNGSRKLVALWFAGMTRTLVLAK